MESIFGVQGAIESKIEERKTRDERKKEEQGRTLDVPRVTTFLTSLLTMSTSNPDLSSLLPGRRDIFPVLPLVIMVMVTVSVVDVVRVWW